MFSTFSSYLQEFVSIPHLDRLATNVDLLDWLREVYHLAGMKYQARDMECRDRHPDGTRSGLGSGTENQNLNVL